MMNNNIEKNWIKITLLSLALSGVYSIFIVLLRTPVLTNIFPDKSIFQTALIIHVDLSVLFWLVSIVLMIQTEYVKSQDLISKINI